MTPVLPVASKLSERAHADESAGMGKPARGSGADAAAGLCAVVRAAVLAQTKAGCMDGVAAVAKQDGVHDSIELQDLVKQLTTEEGELFNCIDKTRIQSGFVGCAMCSKKFHETSLLEGRHEVKVLPCFHSVCAACLQSILADPTQDGITCPLCMCSLKKRTLHAYLPHFEAHSAIDREKIETSDFSCEECVSGARAEAYCEDCQMHMCGECQRQHRRAKSTVQHSVLPLRGEVEQSGEAPREQIVHRAQYCAIHRTFRYEFYCEDCDVLVCQRCIMEEHQNHSYKLPSVSLVARHRARIQEVVERMCAQLLEAQGLQQRLLANAKAREAKVSKVRTEVEESFEQLWMAAEARCSDLTRELLDVCTKRKEVLEVEKSQCSLAIVDLWRSVDFLEKVISRGTDVEVMQVKTQLLERHQHQVQQWRELTQRPLPEPFATMEAGPRADWRSSAESEAVLDALSSFGDVRGPGTDSLPCWTSDPTGAPGIAEGQSPQVAGDQTSSAAAVAAAGSPMRQAMEAWTSMQQRFSWADAVESELMVLGMGSPWLREESVGDEMRSEDAESAR